MGISLIVPVPDDARATATVLEAIAGATEESQGAYEAVLTCLAPLSAAHDDLFNHIEGDVKLIRGTGPLTLGAALNAGAEAAADGLLVFLEPYCCPTPGWLGALREPLEQAALVGSTLVDGSHRVVRGAFGFRASRHLDLVPVPLYAGLPADAPIAAGARACQASAGGALAVWRDHFRKLEGFEPDLAGPYALLDLGLRARQQGLNVVVTGRSRLASLNAWYQGRKDDYLCSERFKERWCGVARLDLFDHYQADGFHLAGAFSGAESWPPLRIFLRSLTDLIEVVGLEPPWPRHMLVEANGRTFLPDAAGGPDRLVPPTEIEQLGETPTHYQRGTLDTPVGVYKAQLDFVGKGKRVLELGISSGYVTRHLVANGCAVVGVELDPAAASAAEGIAERVHVGDLEALDFASLFAPQEFDAVLAGDVLEHLRDPELVLRRLRPYLAPGAVLVGSVPNVSFAAVRLSLLLGQWRYRRLGLLDRTHLRFFTRSSLHEMCRRAGFRIVEVETANAGPHDVEFDVPLDLLPAGAADFVLNDPEAWVYQFVFKAVPTR